MCFIYIYHLPSRPQQISDRCVYTDTDAQIKYWLRSKDEWDTLAVFQPSLYKINNYKACRYLDTFSIQLFKKVAQLISNTITDQLKADIGFFFK